MLINVTSHSWRNPAVITLIRLDKEVEMSLLESHICVTTAVKFELAE